MLKAEARVGPTARKRELSALSADRREVVNRIVKVFRSKGVKFDRADIYVRKGGIVRLSASESVPGLLTKILSDLKALDFIDQVDVQCNSRLVDGCNYWSLRTHSNVGLTYVTVDELYGAIYFQF
jgi:hypothetical protein